MLDVTGFANKNRIAPIKPELLLLPDSYSGVEGASIKADSNIIFDRC